MTDHEADEQGFKYFFLQGYPDFCSVANSLLQDRNAARMLTMEAFFLLWNKRMDFDSDKNRKAFLYTTIRYNCLSYRQRLPEEPSLAERYPGISYPGSMPEEMLR